MSDSDSVNELGDIRGPDTPGEYELAVKRLAEIRAEIVELRRIRDNATLKMNTLLQDEADLVTKYEGTEEGGHLANQKAIMEHLKRQAEARAARVQRRNVALATGISAGDLQGVAPIDAAHTRRTSRGTQRPNFAPKAE